LKIELSTEELHTIMMAIQNMTIQGKDAPLVSRVLIKIETSFNKSVDKDNLNGN